MSALLAVLAAADIADQTVAQWVVGVVATAIVTTLGLLVRHAVGALTASVEANTKELEATKAELVGKMDALKDQVSRADGDRRVLEAELRAVTKRMDVLEQQVREMSEGMVR